MFEKYLKNYLRIYYIKEFKLKIAVLKLFVFKKDKKVRLYVNYWALNRVAVKNCYPLPLIFKLLNRLKLVKVFFKLNLKM